MNTRKTAPLTKDQLKQLRSDANDIRGTAKRKGLMLSEWEARTEEEIAKNHFALGCWLHYYRFKIGLEGPEGLAARIDCARRIFDAGFHKTGYDFFTIFDFGERQFDTIFEMGDSEDVIEGLRNLIKKTYSPSLVSAFKNYGWPVTQVAELV